MIPFKEIGIINVSLSVPKGFYLFDDDKIMRNNYVAIENIYKFPLMKKIIGIPGDKYVLSPEGIHINGVLIEKYNGGPAIVIDSGILKKNEYIVIGEHFKSYDSRHFGKVSVSNLRKIKKFLLWENDKK